MCGQIIDAIFERMAGDPDAFFLIADMGINLVEKFLEKYRETLTLQARIGEIFTECLLS
jgi:hypothetical protein